MELPKRKQNRLTQYDYSAPNAYFITLCTDKRKSILWKNVGAAIGRPEDVPLSDVGIIVDGCIRTIQTHYSAVSVDTYVIMPNHIHMLLQIHTGSNGRPLAAPTVSTIVNQLKGAVSRQVGFSLWQKGFYDHVVRGDPDYRETWQYIQGNPGRWVEDKLYSEDQP